MAKTGDINALTARAAREAGVPVNLYMALITRGERSHKGWQTSPMGAFGPAQLMPGTAKGLARKYGVNVNDYYGNLLGGAYYLKDQLAAFGGDQRKAIAAYNAGPGAVRKYGGVPPYAETQRYVKNILGKAAKLKAPPGTTAIQPPSPMGKIPPPPSGMPDLTQTALGELGRIVEGNWDPIESGQELARVASMSVPEAVGPAFKEVDPKGEQVAGTVRMDPGGGWGGAYAPATQLAQIGEALGVRATSEKRDRKTTKSGGTSDHWVGNKNAYAYDLGGSVKNMDRAAKAIAQRLGIKYNGGPLVATVNRNGLRYQILYRTNVGGNHFDHVHVGVRRT